MFARIAVLVTASAVLVSSALMGTAALADVPAQRFMRVYGTAAPPYGFVQFCQSFQDECRAPDTMSSRRFDATTARLAELDEINRAVNLAVAPATDEEIFGVREHWTMPGARGDCEDYVLLKRRMLMERGWPASALLITVVFDENDEGHAVLTARTAQGDFVLDNKTNALLSWEATPYRYVMRQSYLNPQVWMALDPSMTQSPQALAGLATQ
ncbi:MAG: transglutaminase-like cysteine peptidase [Pseudomonadota bacterium]